MLTKLTAMLAGTTTKSISFSHTVSTKGELVDIHGSLDVVRFIDYGETSNTVVLLATLASNVTAIGRTSGKHYVTKGSAAVARTLPPGKIPDSVTVTFPFAIFPPRAVADIVEVEPFDYPLIVKVIAMVIVAVIG